MLNRLHRARGRRMASILTLDEIRARLSAMLPRLSERYPIAYLGVFGREVVPV